MTSSEGHTEFRIELDRRLPMEVQATLAQMIHDFVGHRCRTLGYDALVNVHAQVMGIRRDCHACGQHIIVEDGGLCNMCSTDRKRRLAQHEVDEIMEGDE